MPIFNKEFPITDEERFKKYCSQLVGKVTELKIDEKGEIKSGVCIFEGRRIKISPTWAEAGACNIIVDRRREAETEYDAESLEFPITEEHLKDVKKVSLNSMGWEVIFSKPKKFALKVKDNWLDEKITIED
jgi:hypothetical protein